MLIVGSGFVGDQIQRVLHTGPLAIWLPPRRGDQEGVHHGLGHFEINRRVRRERTSLVDGGDTLLRIDEEPFPDPMETTSMVIGFRKCASGAGSKARAWFSVGTAGK